MFLSTDKNKKPYRCAIYCRTATQKQGALSKSNSIKAQRNACERYVSMRIKKSCPVIFEHYDDRAYSGMTLNRPSLKRLFEDAKSGNLDVIVVTTIDRLSRNIKDLYVIFDSLKRARVELVSAT